jgi:DNA gyrase subunit B
MYVGDVASPAAIHKLLWDAIERGLVERARSIAVAIDGARITVETDGTGTALEALDPPTPHRLLGIDMLHVTSALSSELSIESWHAGRAFRQYFARGRPTTPIEHLGPTSRHGTRLAFEPDFTLLPPHPWDRDAIAATCRELAALQPALTLSVDGAAVCYPRGLLDHIAYLTGDPDLVAPLHVRAEHAGIGIDVAVAHAPGRGHVYGFANHRACGGAHVDGLATGVDRAFAGRALWPQLASELLAIVHVTLEDTKFGTIARDRLLNPEAMMAVADVVERALLTHFEQAPAFLDAVLLGL